MAKRDVIFYSILLSISAFLFGMLIGEKMGIYWAEQYAIKSGVVEYVLVTNNSIRVEFRFIKDNTK